MRKSTCQRKMLNWDLGMNTGERKVGLSVCIPRTPLNHSQHLIHTLEDLLLWHDNIYRAS